MSFVEATARSEGIVIEAARIKPPICWLVPLDEIVHSGLANQQEHDGFQDCDST